MYAEVTCVTSWCPLKAEGAASFPFSLADVDMEVYFLRPQKAWDSDDDFSKQSCHNSLEFHMSEEETSRLSKPLLFWVFVTYQQSYIHCPHSFFCL